MVLVFGMMVVGCDDGSTSENNTENTGGNTGGSNPFIGTWTHSDTYNSYPYSETITFTSSGYSWSRTSPSLPSLNASSTGTCTYGSNYTYAILNGNQSDPASISGNTLTCFGRKFYR